MVSQVLQERYGMSPEDCTTVTDAMAALDVDRDGELHYSDFLAVMMAPRLVQGDRSAAEEAFRRLDVKGVGHFTSEALLQTLGDEVPGSELQRAFHLLDVDKDSKVYS